MAIVAATGLLPALAPLPAEAAQPSLTIVGATTYRVLPEAGRIAVSVQLTATNHLKNTATKEYFFRTGYVTVLPGTSGFRLTGETGTPKVSVSSATDAYTNLKLDLGANLAAGKSTTLTLDFELIDTGGAPDRPVRISRSLVTFSAWAVATPETPGASVAVQLPDGYSVTVKRGPLAGPTSDGAGNDVWSSGTLEEPLDFVADIAANRPTEFVEARTQVPLGAGVATIVVRAWPDDIVWRERVADLVVRALPLLEREIGAPWPVDGPLAVHEALIRNTGGFAGLFDPAERRIDVAYVAADGVILHELAHAWFNGRLVGDRWIAEAFAAYYAELVARELGIDPATPPLPAAPSPGTLALNDWGPSGTEASAFDDWAYAASLSLARSIAARAGPDAMQAVWAKAAGGIGAYQPGGATADAAPERAGSPPDWRGLLDLLEDGSERSFADLWQTWVARPEDLVALADRAATRGSYVRSVELAGTWALPATIREAMRAWRFDVARDLLVAADGVQVQRARLEAAAAAAGVTLPGRLQGVFEGEGGPAAAAPEASGEQAGVDALAAALAAEPHEIGLVEQLITGVGLIGAQPDARLAVARAAIAAADLEGAYAAAQDASSAWSIAPRIGRARLTSGVLLLVALILLAGLLRQRRRRRPTEPPAPDGPPAT